MNKEIEYYEFIYKIPKYKIKPPLNFSKYYQIHKDEIIINLQQENKHLDEVNCELKKTNQQLKDNWNKLKEWVNKHYDYYMNNEDYIGGRLCFTDMKDKMQELEQGSDSDE